MMDSVKEIFEAAAAKYLTAVDAAPSKNSNQHEIGGLVRAGMGQLLGVGHETFKFPAVYAYIPDAGDDEETPPVICEGTASWYDCRRDDPDRSSEYRLYYPQNEVTKQMKEGDLVVVAKNRDGSLALIFTPAGSPADIQLRHLFGLPDLTSQMKPAGMPEQSMIIPVRMLLEEVGINPFRPEEVEDDLEMLLELFSKGLPTTDVLSGLARELVDVDSRDGPDSALVAWLDREELLFRAYEKHLVSQRLREGFGHDGSDVDAFVKFSLSVQNRRKSRVGYAFENHLTTVFEQHGMTFQRGKGKLYTEGNQQPDWMFPSFSAYHDLNFPTEKLTLLGAKTTCKDRWRQVLAEGDRLERKYLATLEAGISERQTDQMQEKNLQLVVPGSIHTTYSEQQKSWLYTISDFVGDVRRKDSS
jgi:hypothetical protein